MQSTTKLSLWQLASVRLHLLVVLSILVLALRGCVLKDQAGWITCPPQVIGLAWGRWHGRPGHQGGPRATHGHGHWRYLLHTCSIPLRRSLILGGLWLLGGREGPAWVGALPWALWLWQSVGLLWPGLRCQPEWQAVSWLLWHSHRLLMVSYLGLILTTGFHVDGEAVSPLLTVEGTAVEQVPMVLSLGCLVCGREAPWAEVVRQEDGSYQATLCGHFTARVEGQDPFRVRMWMLFLRQWEGPGPQRKGRRTRDGRTPFVTQAQLARWFQMPQPDISRVEKYWLDGDWPNLLSLNTAEVLTRELMGRIVAVFATFPWWDREKVYQYLRQQGVAVSHRQVRQAAEQSGWSRLRQELVRCYHLTPEGFRPRDEWLVSQLLALVETLLAKVEAGEGLTSEEQVVVADLQTLAAEVGMVAPPPVKGLPWLMCVEQVVFGHWEAVTDGQVCCLYCGSTQVVRKSRKPRLKTYYDAEGNLQRVKVYRYYCRNPNCDKGSFTNLPPGLVPYSRYRTEVHLRTLQMYAWGYSTYRRTAQAVGVSSMTAYRWVSAWGYELLPVAALFGVVRCSGVVGIDEKYVLVPKNDKPESDMRRWMYVYFAVDVYTYDLLHIAIYPYNTQESAQAFLLALRAKGYSPKVIVTDLRQDYGSLVAQVFPQAQHHECIFHALQNVRDHVKEVYGADYAKTHPEAEELKSRIYQSFDVKTKRTAQKRYEEVMALREQYVGETPASVVIFAFLEHHWPSLVNGIESEIIPRTNNAVELVIRRFDQHYQTFCGFDTLESACLFLGVFEKVYRFTPFSQDAQPRIRGKCPLALAGYDVSQVPMASLCTGWSVAWPLEVAQSHVPNS